MIELTKQLQKIKGKRLRHGLAEPACQRHMPRIMAFFQRRHLDRSCGGTFQHAALVVIDIQERLAPVMVHRDRLLENVVKLVKGCTILQVPTFATEQYPRGLGPTVDSIREALAETPMYEKVAFSCCAVDPLVSELHQAKVKQVVLVGIEAHVCVLQSALDLSAENFQVHVPYDATSSRKESDCHIALERLRAASVTVTATESVLFELLRQAGTPTFKQVSALMK